MIRAVLIALQFLTRIPVRLASKPSERELGGSACAYPWVGLLLGFVAVLAFAPLSQINSAVAALLLLILLVVLSGALHLDGLADTADAWVGGHGDREATLRIMKDPAVGAMGVVALVLLLLGKLVCLAAIIDANRWSALLIVPLLGRMALLGLLLTSPYVRAQGIGQAIAGHLPTRAGWWSMAAAGLVVCFLERLAGLLVLAVGAAVLWMLREAFVRRLGGVTGDTLGASCEISELVVLAVLAASLEP